MSFFENTQNFANTWLHGGFSNFDVESGKHILASKIKEHIKSSFFLFTTIIQLNAIFFVHDECTSPLKTSLQPSLVN